MLAAGDASKETNTDARYPHCILEVTQEKKNAGMQQKQKEGEGWGEQRCELC